MDKSYIRNTFFKSVGMAALLLALPLLPSCTDDEPVGQMEQVPLQLAVGIDSIASRAMITGNTFDNGSSIGIFVLDMATMSTYDGNTLHNIRYTAQDASGTQKWVSDSETFLSYTQGAVYGYYPYSSGVSLTAVPVQSGSTDYMLGYSEGTVNASKPSTALIFSHAQHAFNINISLDNYLGDGVLTDLTLSSSKLAASKTVNLVDGSVSYTGEGTTLSVPMVNTALGSESSLAGQIMAVSTVTGTNTVDLTVTATVDGKVLTLERSDLYINMTDGFCSDLNIVISGETMRLAGVGVSGWGQTDMGDKDIAIASLVNIIGDTEGIAFSNQLNDDGTVTITAVPMEQNTFVAEASLTGTGVLEQSIDYNTGIMTAVVSDMSGEVNVAFNGVEQPIIVSYYIDGIETVASRSGGYTVDLLNINETYNVFNINTIKKMVVDNMLVTPTKSFSFENTGRHVVKYFLKSNEIPTYMFYEVEVTMSIDFIPNSVTCIGYYAFANCAGLTGELVIPNTVINIKDLAFYGCTGLTGTLIIPNSVTSIGYYAFANCAGLTALELGNGVLFIGKLAFANCTGLTGQLVIPNSVTSIGEGAFSHCEGLVSVTFEENSKLSEIPAKLFEFCRNLKELSLSNGIVKICKYIIYACHNLTKINIPNTVEIIEIYAFYYSGLNSIYIPSSVTQIGYGILSNCNELTSIIVSSENNFYNSNDNCNAIMETATNKLIQGCDYTVIPQNCQIIGHSAFQDCDNLTDIIIPNSVTIIEEWAFSSCDKLRNLRFSENLKTIGGYAFYGCFGLPATIIIPNSVNTIGDWAFADVIFNEIIFGTEIQTIGSEIFGTNYKTVNKITCKSQNPPQIDKNTFYNVETGGMLTVPTGCMEKYSSWLSTDDNYLGSYGWTIQEMSE